MKKSDIKKMIDEIDDRYVEEASGNIKNADKIYIRHYSKIAVAASICLLVVGSGVSVLAATNPAVKSWIRSFYVEDVEEDFGHGIKITNESINTENVSDEGTEAIAESEEVEEKQYYLILDYLPEAYKFKDNDTGCYYGSKGDTDFFQIAFFHLQADFTNILSGSEQSEKYETNAGTAYIASSKYENRVWIMFSGTDYMMELRDRNKVLSNKEIYKIIDGARLSGETPSVLYDSIEWTEELQESYVKQIESYK